MNNKEEKYEGPFLSDLISVIFGRKLLLTIVTLIVTIVLAFIFKFAISDKKVSYETIYSYSNNDLNEGHYCDGSSFNYNSILSLDNLNKVKENNEEFSSINVKELLASGAISITAVSEKREKNIVTIDENGVTKNEKMTFNYNLDYTLKASKKYFTSSDQAKKFLVAVANTPNLKNIDIMAKTDYLSVFNSLKDTIYYEDEIALLASQYDIVNNVYNTILTNNGNLYVNINDNIKNVSEAQTAFITYFKSYSIESISTDATLYGYIKDFDKSKNTLRKDLNNEIYQYNLTKSKIDSYKEFYTGQQVYNQNSSLEELIDENVARKASIEKFAKKFLANGYSVADLTASFDGLTDIYTETELNNFKAVTDKGNKEVFETTLNNIVNFMKDSTNILNEVKNKAITDASIVNYETVSIIQTVGGMNNIVIVIVSLLCGLIVGIAVNLVLDYKKIFKNTGSNIKTEESK